MFDPFNDFITMGYLRNSHADKDKDLVRIKEHEYFRDGLSKALEVLKSKTVITYKCFLDVHRILFSDYYPWAGQDRSVLAPDLLISKAGIQFSHPGDARRAVEYGLEMAQDVGIMNSKPGEVMGLFAYGHPFLDGNGRTMLLVHIELSRRAGFSIDWASTNKKQYLSALTKEIESPGRKILDEYLLPFKYHKS